jgi:hypothetical protein
VFGVFGYIEIHDCLDESLDVGVPKVNDMK